MVANQNSSVYMWCTCKEYTCISLNVFDCRPNSNKLCLLAVKNSASFNKKKKLNECHLNKCMCVIKDVVNKAMCTLYVCHNQ